MNKFSSMSVIISVTYSNAIAHETVEELLRNNSFLKKTLRLAEINGLYYYFMLKLNEMGIEIPSQKERFNEEKQKLNYFKETIELLNNISASMQLKYMIIKACTEIPHVPRDVDILIKECDKSKYYNAFLNFGMTCVHSNDVETSFSKEGYLKIDLYTGVRYITIDFLSEKYLWSSYKLGKTEGIKHPLLGDEANVLLMLVHSLYGHRSMTFLDFLHIARLMQNVDINMAKKSAYECGWGETFEEVLKKYNGINELILLNKNPNVLFPYRFNPNFVMSSISKVKHLDLDRNKIISLHISFYIDRVVYELRKTALYDFLLNYNYIRNMFNSFNYFVRHACGDDKSK